ncbi:MAG TPA: DUF1800 domain-containing protein [Rhodanobacteraceae bacterium]
MSESGDAVTAAVNRFGLGAKPGELAAARDPREWLLAQVTRGLDDGNAFSGLPTSLDYLRDATALQGERRTIKRQYTSDTAAKTDGAGAAALKAALKPYRARQRQEWFAEAAARFQVATVTSTPFVERLVRFWSNRFAVSIDKGPARMLAAPMEREAIRPHVTGRFADMLLAAETHPAMLLYLDNVRSVGPDSRLGQRIAQRLARKGNQDEGKAGGLNENLGRESMELHTVGVHGGYTQADVTEFSRALTGWSIPFARDFANGRQPSSAFMFRANAHEPGVRHVLGRAFAAGGFEQGKAILEFLARQPATAQHLSLKLAQHLVSDQPPPALVARMAKSYLDHDTDLAAVYRTLVTSPEAWGPQARKFRTPQDFVTAALRAGQIDVGAKPQPFLALLAHLGQPPFDARSPAGYSDNSAEWIDPDALWKRVQAAEALSARINAGGPQPLALAAGILGPRLDPDTAESIRRAESTRAAQALLLACPAFQWRA